MGLTPDEGLLGKAQKSEGVARHQSGGPRAYPGRKPAWLLDETGYPLKPIEQ